MPFNIGSAQGLKNFKRLLKTHLQHLSICDIVIVVRYFMNVFFLLKIVYLLPLLQPLGADSTV